jgi:hypothetical protein
MIYQAILSYIIISFFIILLFLLLSGSSSPREVAGHILSSPLRGSIVVELLNQIEYAAKEFCNKDSVLAQKDFCDLAEFKWH